MEFKFKSKWRKNNNSNEQHMSKSNESCIAFRI